MNRIAAAYELKNSSSSSSSYSNFVYFTRTEQPCVDVGQPVHIDNSKTITWHLASVVSIFDVEMKLVGHIDIYRRI